MKRVRRAGKHKLSANSSQQWKTRNSCQEQENLRLMSREQAGKHKIAKSGKQGTVAKYKKKKHFFHLLMTATYLLTGTASA